jgi:hypothetical protein
MFNHVARKHASSVSRRDMRRRCIESHHLPQIPAQSVNPVFEFGANVLTVNKVKPRTETQEKAGFPTKKIKIKIR